MARTSNTRKLKRKRPAEISPGEYTILPANVCNVASHPIQIENFPRGKRTDFYFPLCKGPSGLPVQVPFTVLRGESPGPVLGVTAAVHGNELNGIKIIQNLIRELDLSELKGTVFCCPVVNVPSFERGERHYVDGEDLNRLFPGKPNGVPAEQYAYAFSNTFLPPCDYLLDLHTASEGRTNTFYVRADLFSEQARKMAQICDPEIILHTPGKDGTLRNAAARKRIPAITVEAGNPSVFQGRMVSEGERAVENVMSLIGLVDDKPERTRKPIICKDSEWLRTTGGGMLETYFGLSDKVKKGTLVAETRDLFGRSLERYYAPFTGIVIGKVAYPVAIPGTRFCHLGRVGRPEPKAQRK